MKSVKRDLRHELLSEVHRLLSIASAEDFRAASALCKSENIKLALEALAEEHLSERGVSPTRSQPSVIRGEVRATVKQHTSGASPNEELAQVQQFLSSKPFSAKADLVRFAVANNIDLAVDEKESKQRFIRKIIKKLATMSRDQQLKIISNIPKSDNQQTEGWLEVIRKKVG